MKQKIRIMLTPQALMMATKMQKDEIKPLSHVIEECIRFAYSHQVNTDVGT